MIKIKVLSKNDIFGDEDLIKRNSKRTFNVTCKSNVGILLRIKKFEFYTRVWADENTKKYLLESNLNKN